MNIKDEESSYLPRVRRKKRSEKTSVARSRVPRKKYYSISMQNPCARGRSASKPRNHRPPAGGRGSGHLVTREEACTRLAQVNFWLQRPPAATGRPARAPERRGCATGLALHREAPVCGWELGMIRVGVRACEGNLPREVRHAGYHTAVDRPAEHGMVDTTVSQI
jgi:hypothetical protein